MSEPKKNNRSAWLVALAWLACLVCLNHSTGSIFATGAESVEQGASLESREDLEKNIAAAGARKFIGLGGLLAIAGYCFLTTPTDVRLRSGAPLYLFAAVLLWNLASVVWSLDPAHTVRELVRVVCYATTAIGVARRFDPRQLTLILTVVLGGSATVALGAEVVTGAFQPWAGGHRLHGTLHSNTLASHALIACMGAAALTSFAQTKWGWRAFCWQCGAIVVLTKARTALVTLALGLAAMRLAGRSLRNAAAAAMLLIAAAGLMMIVLGSASPSTGRAVEQTLRMGRSTGLTSLNGRSALWENILQDAAPRALVGHGFGAFWNTERIADYADDLRWFPNHSHNAYIETAVNSGVIGLGLLLALVLSALVRHLHAAQLTQAAEHRFLASYLVVGLLHGLTEAAMVLPRDLPLYGAAVVGASLFSHPGFSPAISLERDPSVSRLPRPALAT